MCPDFHCRSQVRIVSLNSGLAPRSDPNRESQNPDLTWPRLSDDARDLYNFVTRDSKPRLWLWLTLLNFRTRPDLLTNPLETINFETTIHFFIDFLHSKIVFYQFDLISLPNLTLITLVLNEWNKPYVILAIYRCWKGQKLSPRKKS